MAGRKTVQVTNAEYIMINKYTGESVPLIANDILVRIKGYAQETTITQQFQNRGNNPAEFLYCFPKDAADAIFSLTCRVGDTVISATAETTDKAFDTFVQAADEGKKAVLLDFEISDICTLSVANVPAGAVAVVCLKMIQLVQPREGKLRLQIPRYISPRYYPADFDPLKRDRMSNPEYQKEAHQFTFTARVHKNEISSLTSVTVPLAISFEGDEIIAVLNNINWSGREDIILDLQYIKPDVTEMYIARHSNGDNALMVRFVPEPENEGEQLRKCDFRFIVDCSGSMSGGRLEAAMRALELCVRSMMPGSFFNITLFGSTHFSFSQFHLEYTEHTFQQALHFLRNNTDCNLGGTEILSAFRDALSGAAPEGFEKIAFVITDGDIGNVNELTEEAAKQQARVFTIGVGNEVGSGVIKDLAMATGGGWEMITEKENAEGKILAQFARVNTAPLRNIHFVVDGKKLNAHSYSALSPEDNIIFSAFIKESKLENQVELCYTGDKENRINFGKPEIIEDDIPATALAYALTRNSAYSGNITRFGRINKQTIEKVTQLAIKYNLVTEFTSLVGVGTVEESTMTPDMSIDAAFGSANSISLRNECRILEPLDSAPMYHCLTMSDEMFFEPGVKDRRVKGRLLNGKPHYLPLLKTQNFAGFFEDEQILLQYLKKYNKALYELFKDFDSALEIVVQEIKQDTEAIRVAVKHYLLTKLFIEGIYPADKNTGAAAYRKAIAVLDTAPHSNITEGVYNRITGKEETKQVQ